MRTKRFFVMSCSMMALVGVTGLARAQDSMVTYEVTITNMTKGEPLSPPVLVTHAPTTHLWQVGQKASKAVEMVAEEGMSGDIVKECQGKATDIAAAPATPEAHIMPGKSMTMKIKAKPGDVLSAVTMLAATNDGFTGLDNCPLDEKGMAMMNDSMPKDAPKMGMNAMPTMKDGMISMEAMAYDAGTEENTEKKSDTPAPDMGKGHPATDPQQPISLHKGIMGTGDLDKATYGWTGAVAKFEIKVVK